MFNLIPESFFQKVCELAYFYIIFPQKYSDTLVSISSIRCCLQTQIQEIKSISAQGFSVFVTTLV